MVDLPEPLGLHKVNTLKSSFSSVFNTTNLTLVSFFIFNFHILNLKLLKKYHLISNLNKILSSIFNFPFSDISNISSLSANSANLSYNKEFLCL